MASNLTKSAFWKTEDFLAICAGILIMVIGLIGFSGATSKKNGADHDRLNQILKGEETKAPFHTVVWYETFDQLKSIKGTNEAGGKFLKNLTGKPGNWKTNPLESLVLTENRAKTIRDKTQSSFEDSKISLDESLKLAVQAEAEANAAGFADNRLNMLAEETISSWRTNLKTHQNLNKKYKTRRSNKLGFMLGLGIFLALVFGIGAKLMGGKIPSFFRGFGFVFLLASVSYLIAGQQEIKNMGIGYAAWAILIGLIISNTVGTPTWVKSALTTEFYIKTGLVVLGAEILFGKILAIGLPGIFVAWIATPIVLVSTYWFGQKILKISSKTLNMTISADMSVCGVSAAVATAAACKATKEELTLAIGLSMVFTSVMMILLPLFINYVGIPEVLGGAWIGGTIDATGAVVAAGAFLGDTALNVAATIKMIQNILIGLIAFGVAIYFTKQEGTTSDNKIGWGEIWIRFPKFILGFIGASIVFSILYLAMGENMAYTYIDQGVLGGFSKNVRGWLFCLAFVSIGLSTNFQDLKKHFAGGKPLILYLCGQTFNLLLTLAMAYIMFYLIFPHITENI